MSEFGCESWKIHNHLLTQMIQQCQKQLQELRYHIFAPYNAIIFLKVWFKL